MGSTVRGQLQAPSRNRINQEMTVPYDDSEPSYPIGFAVLALYIAYPFVWYWLYS